MGACSTRLRASVTRRNAKVPQANVNKVERGNKPMPDRLLSDIKACVFDAYGTLFDFASAARACVDIPDEAVERLTTLWRDKQLQYTWLRAAQGRHADFLQVTADALDFTLETLGLSGCAAACWNSTSRSRPFPKCQRCWRKCGRPD